MLFSKLATSWPWLLQVLSFQIDDDDLLDHIVNSDANGVLYPPSVLSSITNQRNAPKVVTFSDRVTTTLVKSTISDESPMWELSLPSLLARACKREWPPSPEYKFRRRKLWARCASCKALWRSDYFRPTLQTRFLIWDHGCSVLNFLTVFTFGKAYAKSFMQNSFYLENSKLICSSFVWTAVGKDTVIDSSAWYSFLCDIICGTILAQLYRTSISPLIHLDKLHILNRYRYCTTFEFLRILHTKQSKELKPMQRLLFNSLKFVYYCL